MRQPFVVGLLPLLLASRLGRAHDAGPPSLLFATSAPTPVRWAAAASVNDLASGGS